jgi:hypothetical protein
MKASTADYGISQVLKHQLVDDFLIRTPRIFSIQSINKYSRLRKFNENAWNKKITRRLSCYGNERQRHKFSSPALVEPDLFNEKERIDDETDPDCGSCRHGLNAPGISHGTGQGRPSRRDT